MQNKGSETQVSVGLPKGFQVFDVPKQGMIDPIHLANAIRYGGNVTRACAMGSPLLDLCDALGRNPETANAAFVEVLGVKLGTDPQKYLQYAIAAKVEDREYKNILLCDKYLQVGEPVEEPCFLGAHLESQIHEQIPIADLEHTPGPALGMNPATA